MNYTTVGPRLEQKLTSVSSSILKSTLPISTVRPCTLECGPGGGCHAERDEEPVKCLCPLGKGGEKCEKGRLRFFRGRILWSLTVYHCPVQFYLFILKKKKSFTTKSIFGSNVWKLTCLIL